VDAECREEAFGRSAQAADENTPRPGCGRRGAMRRMVRRGERETPKAAKESRLDVTCCLPARIVPISCGTVMVCLACTCGGFLGWSSVPQRQRQGWLDGGTGTEYIRAFSNWQALFAGFPKRPRKNLHSLKNAGSVGWQACLGQDKRKEHHPLRDVK
jgi:hypothetical protein